ncbi:NUDIX hydrolase [Geobacillus stearothermophilus]|nr:NUDIX hydrolase [Geobacillus stearothermophilus]
MGRVKTLLDKNGNKIIEDEYGRTHFSLTENEGVVILAKDEDSFLLIEQFRQPVGSYIVQLPGGGVEQGESLEQAAKREFLEETGYECGIVHYLGKLLPAPWRSNEITHVFYTEEVGSNIHQQLESHEKIKVIKMDVRDCLKQVKKNKINDSEL